MFFVFSFNNLFLLLQVLWDLHWTGGFKVTSPNKVFTSKKELIYPCLSHPTIRYRWLMFYLENVYPSDPDIRTICHRRNHFIAKGCGFGSQQWWRRSGATAAFFWGESEAVVEVSAFRLGEVLKVEKYHQCQAENGTLTGASTVFIDDWSQIPYFPWRLSGFETLLDSHIPVVFGWFVNLTSTASTCLCSKSLKLRVVLSYAFPKPTSHCPDSPATMIFAKAASARGRGAFFFWAMMGWSCCGIE